MSTLDRRAVIAGIGMLVVAATGAVASPRRHLAEELGPLDLDSNIPREFGTWKTDQSMTPVLPSADLQERLDQLYNSIFSRTYIDASGYRVMFLIAYGADQADRMTLAHLPPSCYSSQGFAVSPTIPASVAVTDRTVGTLRLRTRKGNRIEPVTFWTTVGDQAFTEEVGRRWARARYALLGIIPDGMLVRVSSIDPDEDAAFERQASFVAQMYASLSAPTRLRVFGLTA
jgi:EpsI family protein